MQAKLPENEKKTLIRFISMTSAYEYIITMFFGYLTYSISETRLPELQLPEPGIFEEPNPNPENFQIPERNTKAFRSNNEEELNVSNQNLC